MKKELLALLLLTGSATASAQWSDNTSENNRITPLERTVYSAEFKVNKEGITYVVFNSPGKVGTDTTVTTITYIQILDKVGNKMFPDEGKLISKEKTRSYTMANQMFMVDKGGNALIAVSDCRNAPAESLDLSYTVYKVSPTGEMLWGENGVDLSEGYTNSLEALMSMVQLEDGSYVFAWKRANGNLHCISLQRVSETGEILWEDVCLKENTVSYANPYLVNAGSNQVILVYVKGTGKEIMARKIDFDGSPIWAQDVVVYKGGLPDVPLHNNLKVIPDTKGGAFVSWSDDRAFTGSESPYVSHVKSNGTLGFASGETGEKIGNSDMRGFNPTLTYDTEKNCLYAVWVEAHPGAQSFRRLMMQKIAMTGELKWNPEGVEIEPLEQRPVSFESIQNAGDGKFIIFYMTSLGYGAVTGYAALIDGETSEYVWDGDKIEFSKLNGHEKGGLKSSALTNGGWLTMWSQSNHDQENDTWNKNSMLYMQRVNLDGTFGNPSSINSITASDKNLLVISTSGDENITFSVTNSKSGKAELGIYSMSGQKVAMAYQGNMEEGNKDIYWNASGLAKGTYLATLSNAEGKCTVRIIIK